MEPARLGNYIVIVQILEILKKYTNFYLKIMSTTTSNMNKIQKIIEKFQKISNLNKTKIIKLVKKY